MTYKEILNTWTMGDYERLTKGIIKSISHGNGYGASETCRQLVENNYNDIIFDDILQTVALYMCENECENDSEKITFSSDDFKGMFSAVRKLLESFKNPNTELCGDAISDGTDDDDTATPSRLADYIRIASMNADVHNTYFNEYGSSKINDFLLFVQEHAKPALYAELSDFCYQLLCGRKINAIASIMNIPESRAYYLRKRLHDFYVGTKTLKGYNPIIRKIVCFAKVATTVKKWVTVEHVTTEPETGYKEYSYVDILQDVDAWTYKRVYPHNATITIGDKKTKTTAYTDIHNNSIIPIEGTRIKKYVINMSKNAFRDMQCGIKNGIPKKVTDSGFYYSSVGSVPAWTYEQANTDFMPYIPEQDRKTEKLTEDILNKRYPYSVWSPQMLELTSRWMEKDR